MQTNKKNMKIISCLRKDARMPLTKMSRKIQVPVSTIFDRLKATEGDYITRHTSLLNFGKLGYNARANMTIRVDKNDKKALGEYLHKHESVNSAYKITNGFDYLVEGVFRSIQELEEFKETLEEKFDINEARVYFIVDDIKREEFMSVPDLIM